VEGLASILPFVLIAAAFWFLLIRPQRRQQMRLAETQRSVEIGDQVMLGSGIFGVVSGEIDDNLELEVSPGVRMKVARAAVVRVVSADDAETPESLPRPAEPDEGTGTQL
jgi:preprotein translocase subunit YajC